MPSFRLTSSRNRNGRRGDQGRTSQGNEREASPRDAWSELRLLPEHRGQCRRALSGVKGSNSVKVFGHNLEVDERVADRLVEVMGKVQGIADLGVYRSLGQPNLVIKPDRAACARYGLSVSDVAGVVQAAIGGQAVTQIFEGDRRFDLVVRWKPQYGRAWTRSGISASPLRRRRHPARAGRRYPHRGGCVIHLPRRSGALCTVAFRRARTRSGAGSRRRQAAVGREVKLPEGVRWMGRRIR